MNQIQSFTRPINLSAETERKKIGICVPSGDIAYDEFRSIYADIWLEAAREFIVHRIDVNGSDIVSLRNNISAAANFFKVEWLMFLDSDMKIPQDVVRRLMAHDKDIVGATYVRRKAPYWPLGNPISNAGKPQYRHINNLSYLSNENAHLLWDNEGLIEMELMPLGCMLIKAEVFECLDKPHFCHRYIFSPADSKEPSNLLSEDHTFCQRVREKGYKIWCDVNLSKEIGHLCVKPIYWNSPEAMGATT